MSQLINGGKRKTLRKGNNGLKAWVTFVKKVQKEENLSYKDAIHRAKVRKDKGEKWMTGGKTTNFNPNPEPNPNPNPSSSSSSSSSSDTTSSPMNNDEIEEAAARRRVMLEARRTESSRRSSLATRPRNRQTQSQAVGRGTRRGTRKRKGRKTKK